MDTDPNNEIRNWNQGITPDNDELDISSLIFPTGQLKVRYTTLLSLWALPGEKFSLNSPKQMMLLRMEISLLVVEKIIPFFTLQLPEK